jgi:hypothetical protein
MLSLALLAVVALGSGDAPECRNPPSRVSDSYWDFIDACGCESLVAPSRASADYDRFLKACARWRERNTATKVVVSKSAGAEAVPATSAASTQPAECKNPPSRASSSYWDFIDACGCEGVDPPSTASSDSKRFLKACSDWRERNPKVEQPKP